MVAAALLYAAGGTAADGLARVFAFLAIAVPTTFARLLLRVPEPPDLSRRRLPWREARRLALRNRPVLRLLAAWFVNGAANALPAALFPFFVEHRLQAPERTGPLLVLYFLAAVA